MLRGALIEPTDEARASAVAWVEAWTGRPALERLVREFDGPARGESAAADWLAELERFSERWDFREGRERNLVCEPCFSEGQAERVLEAAAELDLRGPDRPATDRYDAIVILGGLVRASLARPRYGARLLADGSVRAPRVIALGGHRPLGGDELEMQQRFLGARAEDELEAMDAGVRAAFGVEQPVATCGERSEQVGASWTLREYRAADGLIVDVVAAPSSEPGVRRANTADTYEWLGRHSGLVEAGQRVLIVTTRIYRPFQEADAWRMLRLPHEIAVDVVGIDPGEVDPRLTQEFSAHHYLQETRSAIRSMRLLLRSATQPQLAR